MSVMELDGRKVVVHRPDVSVLQAIEWDWAKENPTRWRRLAALTLSANGWSLGQIALGLQVSRVSVLRMQRQAREELSQIPALQEIYKSRTAPTEPDELDESADLAESHELATSEA